VPEGAGSARDHDTRAGEPRTSEGRAAPRRALRAIPSSGSPPRISDLGATGLRGCQWVFGAAAGFSGATGDLLASVWRALAGKPHSGTQRASRIVAPRRQAARGTRAAIPDLGIALGRPSASFRRGSPPGKLARVLSSVPEGEPAVQLGMIGLGRMG